MEYLFLKNSKLKVSRLCMGGCPMGQYGWGQTQEQELLDAVNTAIDNGVNFFDTADTYGLGKSEETLAKALGRRRYEVVIATKFGVRTGAGKTYYDNSPEWIETALISSLKRLRTEYIDLYQIHYRDKVTPISEVIETLKRFREKGYIRYIGLSNIHKEDISELKAYAGLFTSVQDEYSLACRKNECDLLAAREELMVTPMTWGSLGQGILTGKYNKDSVFSNDDRRSREVYVNFHGEKLLKNLKIVEVMRPIAQKFHVSIATIAVRFILDKLKDSVVLVGAKRPVQILSGIDAMGWKLNKDDIQLLDNQSR